MDSKSSAESLADVSNEDLVAGLEFFGGSQPDRQFHIALRLEKRIRELQALGFFREMISGKVVYEIGCGEVGQTNGETLLEQGATKCYEVDPHYAWPEHSTDTIQHIRSDALTFLAERPDNSGIVIANKVFDEPLGIPQTEYEWEYLHRVLREMYRVTPTVCFGFAMYPAALQVAQNIGFFYSIL